MQSLIDNLINGNLSDAKRQAKRHKLNSIVDYLKENLQWSDHKAISAAGFLKGWVDFQTYCDAK